MLLRTECIRRKSTQTVMYDVFTALSKLLAPILAYTAEEALGHAGFKDSVHEQDFLEALDEWEPSELFSREFATEFSILADLKLEEGTELSASVTATEHCVCPRCHR